MKYKDLEKNFRELSLIEEAPGPFISCYLNNETLRRDFETDYETRIQVIRKVLPANHRENFELALAEIEEYVKRRIDKDSKGIALFSRAGKFPYFKGMEFKLPFETSVTVDTVPHLYQLVLMKDTYHRYVVLITEESHARIVEVSVGNITKELWAEKPELRISAGRGWTKQHYQNHKKDRENKFIKEKIAILDKLVSDENHSHLILAGNRQNIARVKDKLPKRLLEKLVDNVCFGGDVPTDEIVSVTLSKYADHEHLQSLDTAELLLDEVQKGGLAVTDTAPTLEALIRGQVDILVMSENYYPPKGWKCFDCQHTEVGDKPLNCPVCDSKKIIHSNLKEEMIRMAEQISAKVEILRDSDKLYDVNGIGCLLRY